MVPGGAVAEYVAPLAGLLAPKPASVADDAVAAHGGTWTWVRPSAEELTGPGRPVDRGSLRIELSRSVALVEAAEAYRLGREGHVRGRTAVRRP